MPFAQTSLKALTGCLMVGLLLASGANLRGAGVTLITHGNSGSTSGWITGMANALSARLGGSVPIYRINVASGLTTSVTKISGGSPLTSASGEIIVMLDWGPVSSDSTTTYNVANVVAPLFGQTNLIADLGGHAVGEFPIHVMGHSRGGSLVCELSRELGERGLWVDQVTALDAHPISGDAPVAAYENVLFVDSYYETNSFLHAVDGVPIPGSFQRMQTVISGGYGSFYDGHSDVHLWYHGTIDLSPTASDTEASFTTTMRSQWWAAGEQKGTNAGFIYTRLGGGDRLSTVQPNGANSSTVRAGFNQKYDLGVGIGSNRTALGLISSAWPNAIQFSVLSSNQVAQGSSAQFHIDFQWAVPMSQTQAVEVFLDADRNPLNGNEQLLVSGTASGTTASQVGSGTITAPLNATNAAADSYAVFVKLTGGGRSRVLYAPANLTVIPGAQPLLLDIAAGLSGSVIVGVNGTVGQRVVLQRATDWSSWQPVVTNVLSAARWEREQPADGTNVFYRAVLVP